MVGGWDVDCRRVRRMVVGVGVEGGGGMVDGWVRGEGGG